MRNLNENRAWVLLALLILSACTNTSSVLFEAVDPLEKVFPENSYFAPMDAHADVARGEHASFQFVVRTNADIKGLKIEIENPLPENISLDDIKTGFVGYVKVGRTNPEPSNDSYKPVISEEADFEIKDAKISIRFEINQLGHVKSAAVLPVSLQGTELGRCLEKVARGTRFGAQRRAINFRIPIVVKRM